MCPACFTSAVWIFAGATGASSAGWLVPLFVRRIRKVRGEPAGSREISS